MTVVISAFIDGLRRLLRTSPLLLAVVNVTGAVLVQEIWTGAWFRVLVAFDIIFVVTGWLTFDAIVKE